MGEILNAIILGIVQGLTEFLPVSSSGHLELAKYMLGDKALPGDSLLMTVVLHFGTALATVYVFRKDILEIVLNFFKKGENEEKSFVFKIIVSMIPATIVGLFFEKQIEGLFSQNIMLVCAMLILTGIILFIADKASFTSNDVTYSSAFKVGLAQAIAITPGISRSGATISSSVLLGIDRAKAAKFSFLMVVPLIFGKIAKDMLDGEFLSGTISLPALSAGFVVSFFTGIFACKWMISIVRKSQLKYFAYYCLIVGLIGMIYAYLH
ncbi:MAG: undecaprenyl-diphosphate phosphatase [Saprospiraceae bacterium]|nr:undecaprenyl-diphosphate phosphatase [Saprospiraceae bacterium]